MGKAELNKRHKRAALMESAYELFTTKGFYDTTIRDISHNAGVAKGTFYLYFKDKVDIRDAVIRSTASRMLQEACTSMDEHIKAAGADMDAADMFIYTINYLIEAVSVDPQLVDFLSKNLSWGLFYDNAAVTSTSSDPESEPFNFVTYVTGRLDEAGFRIRDLKLLIFSLLELISSSCHDVILYQQPVTLEEYKPYLYNSIRLLVNASIEN